MDRIKRGSTKKGKVFSFIFLGVLLGMMSFTILGGIAATPQQVQPLNSDKTDMTVNYAGYYYRAWNKTIVRANDTYAAGIVMDSSKNIYVAATSNWYGIYSDFLLFKYAPDGTLLWSRTWGVAYEIEICYGITTDGTNIYLIGKTHATDIDGDVQVVKYDSNGNQLWNRTWGGSGKDEGVAIMYASGYLWGTGDTRSLGGTLDEVMLIKWDTSGNLIKNWTWGGYGDDRGRGISSFSNSIYICGITNSFGPSGWNAFIVHYNTDGAKYWNITWGGSGSDYCYDLELGTTGYGYLAGYTNSPSLGDYDAFLTKFDTFGKFLWNRTWGDGKAEYIYGIAIDNEHGGSIFTCGETQSYDNGFGDLLVLKYTVYGDEPWSDRWGGSSEEVGEDLVVDDEENFYVCGRTQSFGGGNWKVFLVKYSPYSEEPTIPAFEFPVLLLLLSVLCAIYIVMRSQTRNIINDELL